MVRLEKILYERVLNTQMLSRARKITQPRRLDYREEVFLRRFPRTGLLSFVTSPIMKWLSSVEYKNWRRLCLQRGLSFDDTMEDENDLRRDPAHEHFMRETLHPYHFLLNKWKRAAYHKVDFYLGGFEAPDYIREPARKRTLIQARDKMIAFYRLLETNYDYESTEVSYWGRGQIIVLELVNFYNSSLRIAWNRYFYNEDTYIDPSEELLWDHKNILHHKKYNLRTNEGRTQFENHMNKQNSLFPGKYAPDGEEIDFEPFYAEFEKKYQDQEFNEELTIQDINKIYHGVEDLNTPFAFDNYKNVAEDAEELSGKNRCGTKLPQYLLKQKGMSFMHD